MPHLRQEIRTAIVNALLNRTVAGIRVYPTRVVPLKDSLFPAIGVYTPIEDISPKSNETAPRRLERDVTVHIEGVVAGAGSNPKVDDAADALAKQVEAVLLVDRTLGGLLGDFKQVKTDSDARQDGERLYASFRITMTAEYDTLEPAIDNSTLDDFAVFDAKYNLGGAVAPPEQAEDLQPMETA